MTCRLSIPEGERAEVKVKETRRKDAGEREASVTCSWSLIGCSFRHGIVPLGSLPRRNTRRGDLHHGTVLDTVYIDVGPVSLLYS